MRSSSGCSEPRSPPWRRRRPTSVVGSASTGRSPMAGKRHRASWRPGPVPPSVTCGSGLNSRPSPGSWLLTTRVPRRASAGTGCRQPTGPCSSTRKTSTTSPRSPRSRSAYSTRWTTAWSSIAIAHAYPDLTTDAIDVDADSIATARANVAAAGLTDRVRSAVHDASAPSLGGGPYDLITIFEALHDMNHPVDALRTARASLADGGSVVIADERVADHFNAPGDEIERFNYGWSVLHCLAVGNLDDDSAGTGTVIRPDTVRRYAAEA